MCIKEDPRKTTKLIPKPTPNHPNPSPNHPKTCFKTIPFIPQAMVFVSLQESNNEPFEVYGGLLKHLEEELLSKDTEEEILLKDPEEELPPPQDLTSSLTYTRNTTRTTRTTPRNTRITSRTISTTCIRSPPRGSLHIWF